jgi:hypothetical protein
VQVTVPLTLTLTVPDQFTADLLHASAAEPSYPSPRNPNALATRADAAGLALSGLVRAGVFLHIPMPSLAATLQRSSVPYPVVADANVSIIITEGSENFTAVRSPHVDALQESLLAFAEAAAFELDLSLRTLPELPDSIQARIVLLSVDHELNCCGTGGLILVETVEPCSILLDVAAQCLIFRTSSLGAHAFRWHADGSASEGGNKDSRRLLSPGGGPRCEGVQDCSTGIL